GNLTNPQVMLSSQPALKETEILSLLAFNRNIEGLSEGEINQILSQEIVDIIFQSLQINLFKRMERGLAEGLGLEFFRLSYDLPENTNGSLFFLDDLSLGDLKLEVGKNINEDLLITYSTPLDFHGETSFGINYEISPKFTFNSQLDTFSFKENDYRFKFGLEVKF
ncbi:MAG: translocation/assembly module TamB domain-containing protein, partial [Atribacterota bacterium]|nr:translocation/assembly module TamB domain-containing protein [Atribacterota bacterium]